MTPDQFDGLGLQDHTKRHLENCPSWEALLEPNPRFALALVSALADLSIQVSPHMPENYRRAISAICGDGVRYLISISTRLEITPVVHVLRKALFVQENQWSGNPLGITPNYFLNAKQNCYTNNERIAVQMADFCVQSYNDGQFLECMRCLAQLDFVFSTDHFAALIRPHITDLRPLIATVRLLQ